MPTSEVLKDGQPLPTTFVSNTTLQAQLGKADLLQTGSFAIKVRNPAPGGGTSPTFVTFQVGPGGISNIGEGEFSANVQKPGLQSTLVLTWTHPVNWRDLNEMDVRLVDENGIPALWLGFDGDFGTHGALLIRDVNGLIAGLAIPGSQTVLGSQIATLDVANSVIDGPPGERVTIRYAIIFDSSVAGKTYAVELFASDDNNDGHGFESFGSLTVPGSQVFLPAVIK